MTILDKRKAFTTEQRKQMVADLASSGLTAKEFAEKLEGVSAEDLYRWRAYYQNAKPSKPTISTQRDPADILKRWEESGLSGPKFAKQEGISHSVLYTLRAKVAKKPKAVETGAEPSEPTGLRGDALVQAYHDSGLSQRQFTEQNGIKLSTLVYYIKKHKTRQPPEDKISGGLLCPKCHCDIAVELTKQLRKVLALSKIDL